MNRQSLVRKVKADYVSNNKGRVKREYNPTTNIVNRGMSFERNIEKTNDYYKNNNIAIVRKIPTPIRVTKFDNSGKIVGAFYEERSALDFNGIAYGKHIDFDTKETNLKTRFPFSIIKNHQLEYAKDIIIHGGISFFLIRFKAHDEVYILTIQEMNRYLKDNPENKSIPYKYFKEELKGFFVLREIKHNFIVYDYLKVLDKNNYL